MPGKGQNGGEAGGSRRRRLRTLLLATILVAATLILGAGSASADFWPHLVSASPSGSGSGTDGGHHR